MGFAKGAGLDGEYRLTTFIPHEIAVNTMVINRKKKQKSILMSSNKVNVYLPQLRLQGAWFALITLSFVEGKEMLE